MYRINEIFYSLQGEGHFTGTPAVFLRFSGCNMRCPFCDTKHETFTEMTEEEIICEVSKYNARHIVITGGEPALQLTASLCQKLHEAGFFIQIETNGSLPLPTATNLCHATSRMTPGPSIDWITCSPKGNKIGIQHVDELKLLFIDRYLKQYSNLKAEEYRLQPLDTGNATENKRILKETIDFILKNPKWKLSLQTHKILNVR